MERTMMQQQQLVVNVRNSTARESQRVRGDREQV